MTPDFMGKGFATMWKVAVKEKPLQVISVKDIGYFAAQAFINPSANNSRGISLAGDSLTFEQMAKVFKEKTGEDVPTTYEFLAHGMLWAIGDVGTMFRWFYTDGYGSDIQMLRKEYPELLDFGDWLAKESKFSTKK
jgi:NmrA-like family